MKSSISNQLQPLGVPSANQAQLFVMGKGEILEADKPSSGEPEIGGKDERIWTLWK